MKIVPLSVVVLCAGCVATPLGCLAGVWAPPEKGTLQADKLGEEKARQVLERVRGAWAAVQTISYSGVASADGDAAATTDGQRAEVVCQRAEAGGWKVHVRIEGAGADAVQIGQSI